MNVLHDDRPSVATVVDTLARGGAEKVALSITNNLDRRRYLPIMITTRETGTMAADLRGDVELISLNRTHRFDIYAIKRFARFLDERKVSVVHSHNHSSSYFCRVARLFCRNKWKHVVHDHHGPVVGSRKLTLLDKLLLKNVDFYICVSQALTDRAIKRIGVPKEKCLYLPNGIFIANYSEKSQGGKIRIIQVGRIEPVKNQLMALRAAAVLKKAGFSFEWLFVGKVNDREYYGQLSGVVEKNGLSDCVAFVGERNDIPELLNKSDIGVLTSAHEGLSLAMLEYMAHGLPVVISEVGESADVIRSSGGGFIVPHDAQQQTAEKLAALIRGEDLRIAWGKNNREYVEAYHSVEIMVNKVEKVYDKVLGHNVSL